MCKAQETSRGGDIDAFHLSRNGQRVALVRNGQMASEFNVQDAQQKTADQHLAQARETAQVQNQEAVQQQTAVAARQVETPVMQR